MPLNQNPGLLVVGPGGHIDPATGNPMSEQQLSLPSSMTGISGTLRDLDVTLKDQQAIQKETLDVLRDLAGKQAQNNTAVPFVPSSPIDIGQRWSSSGPSSPYGYSRPRSGKPTIKATFPHPSTGSIVTTDAEVLQEGGVPHSAGSIRDHIHGMFKQQNWGPQLTQVKNPYTGQAQWVNNETGELATDTEIAASRRVNAGKSIAADFLSGGGLPGVADIAGALPEIAAPIAVLGAGYEMGNLISNQRAQNAQFQSVLGGSNASGFGQRLDELGFRFSQFGNMSGQMANQAFMGTTQLGLQGGQRQSALDAIVKQYDDLGMSVTQSLQAMSTAIQAGSSDFQTLTQNLTDVSQAAQQAGVNAEQARSAFIQNMGAFSATMGGTGATQNTAAALTSAWISNGRTFGANASTVSALGSQQMLTEIAGRNGLNLGQAESRASSQNGWYAGQVSNLFQSQIENMAPGITSAVQGWMKSQNISAEQLQNNPTQQDNLGNYLMQRYGASMNSAGMQNLFKVLTGSTTNLSPEDMAYLFSTFANGEFGRQTQSNIQNKVNPNITSKQQAALKALGNPTKVFHGQFRGNTAAEQQNIYTQQYGEEVGKILGRGTLGDEGPNSDSTLRNEYAAQIGQTGVNSSIMDQILQNPESWNSSFKVGNKSGITLSQLINNSQYQQAIESGNGEVYTSGGQIAKTGTKNGSYTNVAQQFGTTGAKLNVPSQQSIKAAIEVTVQPTPYFQKLVKTVQASTGAQGAAKSGVPVSSTVDPNGNVNNTGG